jgi:spermidine synthase
MTGSAAVVERRSTERGEVVLRRAGKHFEVISNGTFLMDTRDGRSERLLVRAALERCRSPRSVLIGGLGVGFSLGEALADTRVREIVVAEVEPALLDWHRGPLRAISGSWLDDPRVTLVVGDVADLLGGDDTSYDAICLDVDNGPDWTVTTANVRLYDDAGTRLLADRLVPGGVLSVWSASDSASYRDRLHRHLVDVEVVETPVTRGDPDVVFLGRRPGSADERRLV